MKMSDHFPTMPVTHNIDIITLKTEGMLTHPVVHKPEATFHAINRHDELVFVLREILDVLEDVQPDIDEIRCLDVEIDLIKETLKVEDIHKN